MLLALVTIGLERMGREKPQQIERILAAFGRNNFRFSVFGFRVRSTPRKPFRRSRYGFIRAYSTPK